MNQDPRQLGTLGLSALTCLVPFLITHQAVNPEFLSMTGHTLAYWTSLGGIVAAIATAVAAWMAFKSVRSAENASEDSERAIRAQLMLAFDERLRDFNDVHSKLRPGGEWTFPNRGPRSQEEWLRVEGYMGVFERMNYHRKQKLFEIEYIEAFYGYRIRNILNNGIIVQEKLRNERTQWRNFVELVETLKDYREGEKER